MNLLLTCSKYTSESTLTLYISGRMYYLSNALFIVSQSVASCRRHCVRSIVSSSSTMTKRHGGSTGGTNFSVKKRRGIKIRVLNVPDSDDEGPPPDVEDYARLLKTRVTASGKIDTVSMKTLPLFEDEDIHDSSEPAVVCPEEVVVENSPPVVTMPAKKKRKKANDSIRCIHSL